MSIKKTYCVGIPTYNRELILVDTIYHMLNQEPPPNEIIIVDQTIKHTEETELKLKELIKNERIKYFFQKKPNLPQARNRILKETKSEITIFIDDDIIPDDNFFCKKHLDNIKEDIVAVVGKVRESQKKRYFKPKNYKSPSILDFLFFDFNTSKQKVITLKGGNHSILTDFALSIGGYDENFSGRALREESDLALRINKTGKSILYDPDCSLFHLAAKTGGCRVMTESTIQKVVDRSYTDCYFLLKHFKKSKYFWLIIFKNHIRQYLITKDTITKPWNLIPTIYGYISAMRKANKTLKANV